MSASRAGPSLLSKTIGKEITNPKRAKDYYYRNHDTLKTKLRECAQARRGQLQESVKTVLIAVADISLALLQIQDALEAFEPARASTPPELSSS
jgi:hypothetical protein